MLRFLILVLWAAALAGQVVPGSYIVRLTDDKAAAAPGKAGRMAVVARRESVRARQRQMRPLIESEGAQVLETVEIVSNALIVSAPDEKAARLAALAGVKRVYPVYEVRRVLDHALPLHKVPAAWTTIGGMDRAGAGIKIGFIDSGIDITHAGFQAPDLQTPDGFPLVTRRSDVSFTNSKVIVARNYANLLSRSNTTAQDLDGHGTATSMTAAGVTNTGPLATITGVAPGAWLGSYKVMGSDGRSSTAVILKALDDAVADGMDVVNLSLGTSVAYRQEYDPLWDAVEQSVALGVIVVAAAGNNGPTPRTLGTPASLPSTIAAGASQNDRIFTSPGVSLPDGPRYTAVAASNAGSDPPVTAPLLDVTAVDPTGLACSDLPADSLQGGIVLILRGTCNFSVKLANAGSAGAVAAVIYTTSDRPLAIMDTGGVTLPAIMVSNADGLDLQQRVADNPGLEATIRFQMLPSSTAANQVTSFSSRGPSPDEHVKPDLVATGSWVYTATQSSYSTGSNMYSSSGYVVVDGTSFSSPLVAGAMALLKSARPGLTADQYRSLLVNSASTLVLPAGQPAPISAAGSGVLNVDAAVRSTIAAAPSSLGFGVGTGFPDVSRDLTLYNLSPAAATFTISVVPFDGGPAPTVASTTLAVDPGGSQVLSVHWNPSGLDPGEYQGFLSIQGTQSEIVCQIPYYYAVPSGIPKDLRIASSTASGFRGALLRQAILFEVTDTSGVAMGNLQPAVEAVEGGGSVVQVVSLDDQNPGVYYADVRLGTVAGNNTFRIKAGDVTKDVAIAGL